MRERSMEVVGSIEELLIEILVRVPARSLVRFKCVSKHWLSLISDSKFCHRHTLQNPRSSVSAVFPYCRFPHSSFIPLDDLDQDPRSNHANRNLSGSSPNCNIPLDIIQSFNSIIQSSNGLFLCSREEIIHPQRYYVLNPTTNQFRELIPPAVKLCKPFIARNQALAFDPSRSPHYKLIVVWLDDYRDRMNIYVYSSEAKIRWRQVDYSKADPNNYFSDLDAYDYVGGVYWNGAVHWVGWDKQLSYYHIDDERAGHVHHHRLSEVSTVPLLQESHCGSHLHLIENYSSRIGVSEMKRDYSGWCLKYCINIDPILTDNEKQFAVLFLTREETTEGDESLSLLIHIPGQVISYNLKTEIFNSFQLTPRQGIDDSTVRVTEFNYPYIETLACV